MRLADRFVAWNARQARAWSVPLVVGKGFVGLFVAALVLALLAPALRAAGYRLQEWMVWASIVLSVALCVGPDLYRRYRGTRGPGVSA